MSFQSKETPADASALKWISLSIRTETGTHELQLYLDPTQYTQKILWDHLNHGQLYEMETLECIARILKPGDLFIDVGAHIGFISLMASKWVGNQGKVIALEPEASNAARFMENIRLNKIDNIDLLPMAAGSEDKEVDFFQL